MRELRDLPAKNLTEGVLAGGQPVLVAPLSPQRTEGPKAQASHPNAQEMTDRHRARLDMHHSHFILFEEYDDAGKLCQSLDSPHCRDLRLDFELSLSRDWGKDDNKDFDGNIPIVSVCVHGTAGTIKAVKRNVHSSRGIPTLLVRGSGGAADFLADLMEHISGPHTHTLAHAHVEAGTTPHSPHTPMTPHRWQKSVASMQSYTSEAQQVCNLCSAFAGGAPGAGEACDHPLQLLAAQ